MSGEEELVNSWEKKMPVHALIPVLFGQMIFIIVVLAVLMVLTFRYVQAEISLQKYAVTITNLTKGQQISAPLLWSHNKAVIFFELGMPASQALQSSAEAGNTGLLSDVFIRSSDVEDVVKSSEGLLNPGDSVTLMLRSGGAFNRISFISMLNPTNDGFVAVQGVKIPKNNKRIVVDVPAYDAGSEINDEQCASIPGVLCDGEGRSSEKGEGFVHFHTGIHGIGDLKPEERDWRNPVARLSIRQEK